MAGMLASVENLTEALQVLAAGVDIIDLKSPSKGALGALPIELVKEIVLAVDGRLPVSATIGDLPMYPKQVGDAVEAMASTGVDYVKIGFFPDGDWQKTIIHLAPLAAEGVRLVAVLFGDLNPRLDQIPALAISGFSAVMLDTMDKRAGSLTQVCTMDFLQSFIIEAKAYGMLCGLAGSLRQTDIPALLDLQADYLGFRGALCIQQNRTSKIEGKALHDIRAMLA